MQENGEEDEDEKGVKEEEEGKEDGEKEDDPSG